MTELLNIFTLSLELTNIDKSHTYHTIRQCLRRAERLGPTAYGPSHHNSEHALVHVPLTSFILSYHSMFEASGAIRPDRPSHYNSEHALVHMPVYVRRFIAESTVPASVSVLEYRSGTTDN